MDADDAGDVWDVDNVFVQMTYDAVNANDAGDVGHADDL